MRAGFYPYGVARAMTDSRCGDVEMVEGKGNIKSNSVNSIGGLLASCSNRLAGLKWKALHNESRRAHRLQSLCRVLARGSMGIWSCAVLRGV